MSARIAHPCRAGLGLLAAAALPLVACSDPKAASAENFRAAIEPVVRDAFCRPIATLTLTTVPFGQPEPAFPLLLYPPTSTASLGSAEQLLEGGARAGLLTRSQVTLPVRVSGMSGDRAPRSVISYQPTKKGAAMFHAATEKGRDGRTYERPTVCAAKGKLVDVVRWTDPADAFGTTVTRVTYRYVGEPSPVLSGAEGDQFRQPKEGVAVLEKTSDGWRIAGS